MPSPTLIPAGRALVDATLDVLFEIYGRLEAMIAGSDEASLAWRPAVDGANTVSGLVRHIVASNDSWFSRALGEPVVRDRDAEFGARESPAGLAALLRASRESLQDKGDRVALCAPSTVRHVRRLDREYHEPLTVAWCLTHTLAHTGEHWGQALTNLELYRGQR
jgi:uncharacterized damage-inducible protein DinB